MEGRLNLRVFTHPACSGCARAVREAWKLEQEHPRLSIRTVSLENREGLAEARAHKVRTIPTLVLDESGRELRRWVGAPAPGELEEGLRELSLPAREKERVSA